MDFIRRRCLSVFGHIARLTQGTPAHNALHCQVGLACGCLLGGDWRRGPGRPRARWTDQLRKDTNLWRQAILRGHGGAMRRPELAMRWQRRRWRQSTYEWDLLHSAFLCICRWVQSFHVVLFAAETDDFWPVAVGCFTLLAEGEASVWSCIQRRLVSYSFIIRISCQLHDNMLDGFASDMLWNYVLMGVKKYLVSINIPGLSSYFIIVLLLVWVIVIWFCSVIYASHFSC